MRVTSCSGMSSITRRWTTTSSRLSSVDATARRWSQSWPCGSRFGRATGLPLIARLTRPVSAGIGSSSGRLSHANTPLTVCAPRSSRTLGTPLRKVTGAGRLAVGPHVERCARGVARKRDPTSALHEPVLGEATGPAVEVERQARRPRALAMIRRALEEGAERLLVAVHHPVGPRAKRLGDLLARERLGRRREKRQPPHHHRRREPPHRLTPPASQPTSPRTALQTVAHGASLRQLDTLDPVEL